MNTPAFKDKFLAFIFKNFQWLLALVILSGVFDSVVGIGVWVAFWFGVLLFLPIIATIFIKNKTAKNQKA